MIGYILIAFVIGGLCGMMGMAVLACGSKVGLMREHSVLSKRLDFLEREGEKKRYQPVKDPRPHVHNLVN